MNLSAPVVPPRPYSAQGHRPNGGPPLVSPRPHRVDSEVPANLNALTSSSYTSSPPSTQQSFNTNNMPTPPFAGGFAFNPNPPPPSYDAYPPPGPGNGTNLHHAPSLPMPMPSGPGGGGGAMDDVNASFNRLSLGVPENYHRQRAASVGAGGYPLNAAASFSPQPAPQLPFQPQAQGNGQKPELMAPLPTIATLNAALPAIESPQSDLASKVAWIRDVLLLVTRTSLPPPSAYDTATYGDSPSGPLKISDPALERIAMNHAIPLLLSLPHIPSAADGNQVQLPPPATITPANAEALHIHASLLSAGSFPSILPQNQRTAFREFECAARAGFAASWYKIGRDYERFGDMGRAREAFEKGAGIHSKSNTNQSAEDPSCVYRMAIAHLTSQLQLPRNPYTGLRLLARAANLASIGAPHPAYVLALVLLGEGSKIGFWSDEGEGDIEVESSGIIPVGKTSLGEGKRWLERGAWLGFVPAQYKLGHCYEFAEPHPPFAFDPLMSVQYYTLASQAGEPEADMALSKWFLCGSDPDSEDGSAPREGGFVKDEVLAYTFAEKAAKRGLVSAEFALGYYSEVGIGTPKDIRKAIGWYETAASHGSSDARQRLNALGPLPPPSSFPQGPPVGNDGGLSRSEHDALTQNRLVRKRTQAKQRSGTVDRERERMQGPMGMGMGGQAVLENVRQNASHPAGLPVNPRPGMASPPLRQASLEQTQPGSQSTGMTGLTPAQQIVMANRPRYSLADPGFTPPSGPGSSPRMRPAGAGPGTPPGGSPRMRPNGGGGRGQRTPSGPPPGDDFSLNAGPGGMGGRTQSPPPQSQHHTKYNTFADMGIQGQKAQKEECIVM